MIYNGLAGSYLNYGIAAWGSATATVLNRLDAAQNKLMRYMTHSPPRSNVNHLYQVHKVLTVKQLYIYELGKFVHGIHNNIAPAIFHDYLPVASDYRPT